jgi:DNA primase
VLIASDADPSGDAAAGEWRRQLGPFATDCERLLPKGAKDWNELLQAIGRDALADLLAGPVMMEVRALQSLETHGGGAAFEDEE